MKKLISILLVLIFTLSLTACGGSAGNDGGDANEQKPILAETINKNALTGGDNVSFVFGETENEAFVVNVKAPDLLKGAAPSTNGMISNENIKLRIFGRSFINTSYSTYFSFKGYSEIIFNVSEAKELTLPGTYIETILQDGNLALKKINDEYQVWISSDDYIIKIRVDGYNGYRITDEEGYKAFYNTIKEHFTFARIKTNRVKKDGLVYDVLDLNKAKAFGEDKTLNVNDWVFASDLIHSKLKENELKLATSAAISGSNESVILHYFFENASGDNTGFHISLKPLDNLGDSFNAPSGENDFAIGDTTVRPDSRGASGNFIGLILKTKTGKEYHCSLSLNDYTATIDFDAACKYMQKFLAK